MSFIIYVIDTETTGLNAEEHDVIEVSLSRFSLDDTDKLDQKTWCIRAMNPETITEKALTVNGHIKEDITHQTIAGREKYKEPEDVISEIEAWVMEDGCTIDERVFAGQNPEFDFLMLRSLWKKSGSEDTFPFGKFILDTIAIARFIDVCTNKRRPRYNLASLVKDFGVVKRAAHRAEGDTQMTKELFLKMILPLREIIIEKFIDLYQK